MLHVHFFCCEELNSRVCLVYRFGGRGCLRPCIAVGLIGSGGNEKKRAYNVARANTTEGGCCCKHAMLGTLPSQEGHRYKYTNSRDMQRNASVYVRQIFEYQHAYTATSTAVLVCRQQCAASKHPPREPQRSPWECSRTHSTIRRFRHVSSVTLSSLILY